MASGTMATAKTTKTEMAEGRRALGRSYRSALALHSIASGWRSNASARRSGRGVKRGPMRREGVQLARMCDGVVVRSRRWDRNGDSKGGARTRPKHRPARRGSPKRIHECGWPETSSELTAARDDRRRLGATVTAAPPSRPATRARACSCVTATMVKQRMRGKVAVGKQAATEKASPPDDASDVVEKVCPPLGRRCREIPRVVGVRRRVVRPTLANRSPAFPLAHPSLPFPPPPRRLWTRCPRTRSAR